MTPQAEMGIMLIYGLSVVGIAGLVGISCIILDIIEWLNNIK